MFTVKVMNGKNGRIFEASSVDVITEKDEPNHPMLKNSKRRAFVRMDVTKTAMVDEGESLYITDGNNNTVYSMK